MGPAPCGCGGCNGRCGPVDGCNCTSCHLLDGSEGYGARYVDQKQGKKNKDEDDDEQRRKERRRCSCCSFCYLLIYCCIDSTPAYSELALMVQQEREHSRATLLENEKILKKETEVRI